MSKIEVGLGVVIVGLVLFSAKSWLGSDSTDALEECIQGNSTVRESNECRELFISAKKWCSDNGGILNSEYICEISGSMTVEELNSLGSQ